jgi:hypothetical protein
MATYFCHECARASGRLPSLPPTLTGSVYQVDKFLKHTRVPSVSDAGVVSVFDNPDHDYILNYAITASVSGTLQIDDHGRENMIWIAGERTGWRYEDGRLVQPENAVKLVDLRCQQDTCVLACGWGERRLMRQLSAAGPDLVWLGADPRNGMSGSKNESADVSARAEWLRWWGGRVGADFDLPVTAGAAVGTGDAESPSAGSITTSAPAPTSRAVSS